MPKISVGTSGWNYSHWKGIFYPQDLSENKWLEYYTKFFDSVELNVTFYRLPPKQTFEHWHRRTPKNFGFVAKGSRFITHIKRLTDDDLERSLKLFLDSSAGLKEKLLAILWQLPPSFKKDRKRLEGFLELLKKSRKRQVFEFRDASWFDKEIYALLKKYNACLCVAYSPSYPCVKESTADFLYLRFHGSGSLYSSTFSDKELKEIAAFARSFKEKDIFAFFNNDAYGYAVKDALRFRGFLGKG